MTAPGSPPRTPRVRGTGRPKSWFAVPPPRRVQAKDIADDVLLAAVRSVRGIHGAPCWSSLWDVQRALSQFPPKVVQAKLASAVRRGLLDGCACGCRGDFEEPCPTSWCVHKAGHTEPCSTDKWRTVVGASA